MILQLFSNSKAKRLLSLFKLSSIGIACLIMLANSFTAYGLPEDRYQKLDISAAKSRLDNLAGTIIYEGNVILTQGTLKIQADRLVAYANENQEVDRVVAEGKPARYQQVTNPDEPLTKAYGKTIIYNAFKEQLMLLKEAGLTQGPNLFTGDRIEYDMKSERVTGQGDKNASPDDDASRIRMILQPKRKPQNP